MKFLALVVLLTASAFAADIDGKWTGVVEGGQGPVNLLYNLKAEGETLTGSMVGPDGMEIKIENGKIEGNKVSFTVNINFGQPLALNFKGEQNGAELKLTLDFNGMPVEITLKKS